MSPTHRDDETASGRWLGHRPALYEALSAGERRFAGLCRERPRRKLEAQAPVIALGEAHNQIYWLRAGWAHRYRFTPDGRRQILDIYLPGDVMGLDGLFLRNQPHAIETLTRCSCYVLDLNTLLTALERPESALWMSWTIMQERLRIDTHATWLGRYSAEERIAAFFLELYDRLRRLQIVNGHSFLCPLTQRHLADCLGITIVHANRVLKRLQTGGIASMQYRSVLIHDLERLHALANPAIKPLPTDAVDEIATPLIPSVQIG